MARLRPKLCNGRDNPSHRRLSHTKLQYHISISRRSRLHRLSICVQIPGHSLHQQELNTCFYLELFIHFVHCLRTFAIPLLFFPTQIHTLSANSPIHVFLSTVSLGSPFMRRILPRFIYCLFTAKPSRSICPPSHALRLATCATLLNRLSISYLFCGSDSLCIGTI